MPNELVNDDELTTKTGYISNLLSTHSVTAYIVMCLGNMAGCNINMHTISTSKLSICNYKYSQYINTYIRGVRVPLFS